MIFFFLKWQLVLYSVWGLGFFRGFLFHSWSQRSASDRLSSPCTCVCTRGYTSTSPTAHIPSPVPPTWRLRQVWKTKLADTWPRELIILDPGPITPHYPLCLPLRGELRNNGTTWKLAASQGRGLMDTPERLCLLVSSSGRLTFKSLSLQKQTYKAGHCSESGSMTSGDEVQRGRWHREQSGWKWMFLSFRGNETPDMKVDGPVNVLLVPLFGFFKILYSVCHVIPNSSGVKSSGNMDSDKGSWG